MEGIYVSYDEKERGSIEEAVDISNDEYLTYRYSALINKSRFKYPTKIIIRIKGKEKYYQGNVLFIADFKALNYQFIKNDGKHMPLNWRNAPERKWKNVSFLTNLKAVKKPNEIRNKCFPRRPIYFDLKTNS
jgi:hypothetical protein